MNTINKLRDIHRSFWFYILAAIQSASLVMYYFASRNLEKPAGIKETFKFLFNNTDEYFMSLLIGTVGIIIFAVIFMSIIADLSIVEDFTDEYDRYDSSYYNKIEIRQKLINIIICIGLFILDIIFLKYLLSLIGVIFIMVIVFVAVMWGINN